MSVPQLPGRTETAAHHVGMSARGASNLRIERIASLEDLDRVRDEWDSFVEHVGSDIYFTVDWLQAWWTHYGRGRAFHGFIVWDGARMVGVLPFCVQRVWVGPVPVRLAKFVGADSTLPVFTPAVAEGFEEPVLRAALELLFDDAGCDAVSLSPLSGLSPVTEAAEQAVGDAFRVLCSDSPGPHTVFHLPGSFEEYLQSLSKAQRKDYRRGLRTLNSRHEISFRTVSGDEAIAYFDRFVELHAAQWRLRGKLGHFGDWPAGADFNRDLISRMAATGRARCYVLARDGRPLAMRYGFVLGERYFSRLQTRDPDPELEKLGIGRLSHTENIRVLIEDGQRVIESGPGHYDYKLRLGAEEHPLRRIVISRRSGPPRWRSILLLRWADVLHLVYYRVWFLKLRPKLGLSPRPLRRAWIQTRI
jgi:CelD/BcsL family acetyltransferase involved in cellulose biosynthesis